MNKIFLSALLLLAVSALLLSCAPTVPPTDNDPTASVREAVFSVFCSFAAEDGGFSADGSAVLLASDEGGSLLVTSYHVLHTTRAHARREGIYLHPFGAEAETGVPAECVWEAPDYDLALLHTTVRFGAPPVLSDTVPDSGEPILVLGNGGGVGVRVKEGSVTAGRTEVAIPLDYRTEPLSLPLLSFTAELSAGDSGGGLFDKDGRLLGIVNAMRTDSAKGYAIPSSYVRAMLSEYQKNLT